MMTEHYLTATFRLRRKVHDIANALKGTEIWSYYESLAESLDVLVDGNPDPWDAVPFTVYKGIEGDKRFDGDLVAQFREEWAKDIAWASTEITGRAEDMKRSLGIERKEARQRRLSFAAPVLLGACRAALEALESPEAQHVLVFQSEREKLREAIRLAEEG